MSIDTRDIERKRLMRKGGFYMDKKKYIRVLISIIILSLPFLSPGLVSESRAETRITITVAAGGVACGMYFFLNYAFRLSMSTQQNQIETAAIFNLGPEDWQIRFPMFYLIRSAHHNASFSLHAPEVVQIDILNWRF
jgi:hypothetical protein